MKKYRKGERWRRYQRAVQRASNKRRRHSHKTKGRGLSKSPLVLVFPKVFHIATDPTPTLEKIREFRQAVRRVREIRLDFNKVQVIGLGSLAYILSVLDRETIDGARCRVSVIRPRSEAAKQILERSGFLVYKSKGASGPHTVERETFAISVGMDAAPSVVNSLRQFVARCLPGIPEIRLRRLYEAVMEMMDNTKNHAYGDFMQPGREPLWLVMATVDEPGLSVRVTFLDQGHGIPATVKRARIVENRLLNPIGMGASDADLLRSSFGDAYRSRTGEPFRGKGLPRVKSTVSDGHIQSLVAVSLKGFYRIETGEADELPHELAGTMFSLIIAK